jgi:ribosomal protein S18 acetylase RimI-like enzyme
VPEIVLLERSHDRNGFDCGIPELNKFLKATARQHSQKGVSRTFVLTEDRTEILGYMTLTLCEVSPVSLPAAHANRYPSHLLPAVRLARLAVSNKARGRRYGELLLSEALHRTACIADQAGVIGLFVDAKDESARQFYLRYGFHPLSEAPLQLFLPIETIRRSL